MAENRSLLNRFTAVAGQIGTVLSQSNFDSLDRAQVKLVGTIKRLAADARLDIRDWEMADSREEMQRYAHDALKRVDQLRASILLASEHDLFSAIHVADITSQLDAFESELRL